MLLKLSTPFHGILATPLLVVLPARGYGSSAVVFGYGSSAVVFGYGSSAVVFGYGSSAVVSGYGSSASVFRRRLFRGRISKGGGGWPFSATIDSLDSPDSPDSQDTPDSLDSQGSQGSLDSPDSLERQGSPDSPLHILRTNCELVRAHNVGIMPPCGNFCEGGCPSAPQLPTPVGGGGVHYHQVIASY